MGGVEVFSSRARPPGLPPYRRPHLDENAQIRHREDTAAQLTLAWAMVTENQGALAKTVVFATYRDFLERLERLEKGLEDIDERVI